MPVITFTWTVSQMAGEGARPGSLQIVHACPQLFQAFKSLRWTQDTQEATTSSRGIVPLLMTPPELDPDSPAPAKHLPPCLSSPDHPPAPGQEDPALLIASKVSSLSLVCSCAFSITSFLIADGKEEGR